RLGTWAARRSLASSASRPKHQSAAVASAQTLGRTEPVKSNKQRRTEILAHRRERAEKLATAQAHDPRLLELPEGGSAPCNPKLLTPPNSYGVPPFVARGYYVDTVFQCSACQKQEVWLATQQKWWYEVAKGNVESRAKLCNSCRRAERERRAEARRVHLEGVAKKLATESAP
ncbi:zinc-ribbon domain containing protein, partial [Piscinibacter defluvii]|uniref:zinc-ribbon domain containing protein n=1 Tax=Piscinibacter defluvii TaxID=1796922 RepID=UPI001F0C85C7